MWTDAKKLGLAMFSMPAAIGLLDKYEEDLGLSDLLKKIVLNYEAIAAAIWGWVGTWLTLPPDFDINFYTFFALVLIPVLFETIRHQWQGTGFALERPGFWGVASGIAFFGYSIAFSTTGYLIYTLTDTAIFIVFFIAFIIIVSLAIIALSAAPPTRAFMKWLKYGKGKLHLTALLAAGLLLLLLFSVFFRLIGGVIDPLLNTYLPSSFETKGGNWAMMLVSVVLLMTFVFNNLRAPAYAFFWFFGIIALDYLATDFLPAINHAVDGIIGAS